MKDRTILVTGASSGIGKATAEKLIGEGYAVYVAARRVEHMRDLEQLGCVALKMDITQEQDVAGVVERIEKERGGIDILINNAGYAVNGAVEDVSIDAARQQFEVNLFGLARLTQLVLPYMRAKRAGTIVNVSSVGGRVFTPLGAWYHGTKHALEGWSDCLRYELRPFNINVVIIQPGAIATEFADVMEGPMVDRSGNGPYAELTQKLARGLKNMRGSMSPPTMIADVISKALKTRKPKTRYAAGKYASTTLFIRRWFGDRTYERFLDMIVR